MTPDVQTHHIPLLLHARLPRLWWGDSLDTRRCRCRRRRHLRHWHGLNAARGRVLARCTGVVVMPRDKDNAGERGPVGVVLTIRRISDSKVRIIMDRTHNQTGLLSLGVLVAYIDVDVAPMTDDVELIEKIGETVLADLAGQLEVHERRS